MFKNLKLTKKQVEAAYPEWAMYEANRKGLLFDPKTRERITYPEDYFDPVKVEEGRKAWRKVKKVWITSGAVTGAAVIGATTYGVVKHTMNSKIEENTEEPKNIEG
jgi:hypothetical protein